MLLQWDDVFPLVKDLIDKAVDDMGVNCFRQIASPDYVLSATPRMDLSTYLANYSEMISYCASKGCYVEATGCGWQNLVDVDTLVTFPEATIIDHLTQFALMANGHDNVIGIDLVQEVNGWGNLSGERTEAQNVAFIETLIGTVKSAGVTKQLTCSIQPWLMYEYLFDLAIVPYIAPHVDYLSFHVYYYPFHPSHMDPALEHGKPIYLGEVGIAKSGSVSYGGNRLNFITDWQTYISDPNITGISFWCLNEDATPAQDFPWGMYDNYGVPYRPPEIAAYAAIPVAAPLPATLRKLPKYMFLK